MAAKTFEIEGLSEQVKQLRKIMSDDPDFRKRVNAVIRKILMEARKGISNEAKHEMDSDPRHAYKAVRSAVYKRILGGQVNILQKRRAGRAGKYEKPRKGLPKRGGNRWGRSLRTAQLEGYEGADRGFVLRFINAGTGDRAIHSYTDREGTKHDLRSGSVSVIKTRSIGGNRGSITGRNWFGSTSQKELEKASVSMQEFIDKIIAQEFI